MAKKVKQKNFAPGSKMMLSMAAALLFVGGVFVGQQMGNMDKRNNERTNSNHTCSKYGISNQEDFLTSYTVQSGDTLLSIATQQLSDPSRVNEIIELNKKNYPELGLENPFLEVGWNIFLPPQIIKTSSGKLTQYNGALTSKNSSYWMVKTNSYDGAPEQAVYISSETNFDPNYEFEEGDCISALVDETDNSAFLIHKQVD